MLIYGTPFKITQPATFTLANKDKKISNYHKLANTFNIFFVNAVGNLNVNPNNTGLLKGSFLWGVILNPLHILKRTNLIIIYSAQLFLCNKEMSKNTEDQ